MSNAKLKIYKVIGEGFVIAEELTRSKENIFVRYPAVITMIPHQKTRQLVPQLRDLVPGFFKNYDTSMKKFPIKRLLVSMEDDPNPIVIGWYEQYLRDLTKRMTGLETVGAGALNALPQNPDGSPLIQ